MFRVSIHVSFFFFLHVHMITFLTSYEVILIFILAWIASIIAPVRSARAHEYILHGSCLDTALATPVEGVLLKAQ